MSAIKEIEAVIKTKNEALQIAIDVLILFRSMDHDDGCEGVTPDDYHWRGCPDKMDEIIDGLRSAIKEM